MTDETDSHEPLTVTSGGVTVRKQFVADEFPVPAIEFTVTSDADDQVRIRLVDDLPESFPMESVGFHPEYDSDRWTAYKDHRVEYTRALDPSEEVSTVYGIRIDDEEDAADFMTEPALELVSAADAERREESVEDVLGADDNRVVREVLSGVRDTLPGLDAEGEAPPAPEVAADDSEGSRAAGDQTSSDGEEVAPAEPEGATTAAESAESTNSSGDLDDVIPDPDEEVDASGGIDASADEPTIALNDGDVASESTADEGGTVETAADEDVAVTSTEQDAGDAIAVDPTTSMDADDTVADSQTTDAESVDAPAADGSATDTETVDTPDAADVSDDGDVGAEPSGVGAEAAGDLVSALAAELRRGSVDDEDLELVREELGLGVPRNVDVRIARLQSRMEDLAAYSDALSEFIDENGTGEEVIAQLHGEIDQVSAELEELDAELDEATGRIDRLDDDVDDATADVSSLDEEIGEVREDIASLDGDIVDVRDRVESKLADVRNDQDELQAAVEELETFRDRLRDTFGPGQPE